MVFIYRTVTKRCAIISVLSAWSSIRIALVRTACGERGSNKTVPKVITIIAAEERETMEAISANGSADQVEKESERREQNRETAARMFAAANAPAEHRYVSFEIH